MLTSAWSENVLTFFGGLACLLWLPFPGNGALLPCAGVVREIALCSRLHCPRSHSEYDTACKRTNIGRIAVTELSCT